jgi:bifunctional DNase/RNase
VVFLTDAAHARIVPIQVGEGEAIAIAFRLADRSTERPLTHDLLQATIQALGAQVVQVRVHDLADGVFHATVILRRKRALIPLEARASDAIVLALGADLPVWMDRALYDRAGVSMEDLLEGLERLDRLRELPPDPDQAL